MQEEVRIFGVRLSPVEGGKTVAHLDFEARGITILNARLRRMPDGGLRLFGPRHPDGRSGVWIECPELRKQATVAAIRAALALHELGGAESDSLRKPQG